MADEQNGIPEWNIYVELNAQGKYLNFLLQCSTVHAIKSFRTCVRLIYKGKSTGNLHYPESIGDMAPMGFRTILFHYSVRSIMKCILSGT